MTERAVEVYEKRSRMFAGRLLAARKRGDRVVLLRLLSFLVAAALAGYGFYSESSEFALYALSPAVAFIFLVINHLRIKENIIYLENMVSINEEGLRRLSWEWEDFPEKGDEYADPEHPYTIDLSIFGRGSLFQQINATVTYMGKQALAELLKGQEDRESIEGRQEAVGELAAGLHWRQYFQAQGMGSLRERENPARLLSWAQDKKKGARYINLLLLFPAVTFVLFLLFFLDSVSLALPLSFLAVQGVTVLLTESMVGRVFAGAEIAADRLKQYGALLRCIEECDCKSERLKSLKARLFDGPERASAALKSLAGIAERIKFRHYQPIIYFPVNVLTFWDLYTLRKLERWKGDAGASLKKWFAVVGEFESCSSLAGLAFENPDWAFPEITEGPPIFKASSLGHPLIKPSVRVCNDVSLPHAGTALIITGSNMSGKTTFLRTVGINLVLAYAGAPVCAKELKAAYLPVYSKMQVVDDLSQGVSTYYAELTRIKTVIEAARSGKPIIYLLDEIFRGTNSKDRILGTKAIIKMLTRRPTLGLVTTHDLELAVLAEENPRHVQNFHFTDHIQNGKISFDYRLKSGVSKSTNAIALMKMVGIDVEGEEPEEPVRKKHS